MRIFPQKMKESKVFIFCHGMISYIKYIGNIRLTKSDNLSQKKSNLSKIVHFSNTFFGTPKKNVNKTNLPQFDHVFLELQKKDVYKTNLPQFDHVSADLVSPA